MNTCSESPVPNCIKLRWRKDKGTLKTGEIVVTWLPRSGTAWLCISHHSKQLDVTYTCLPHESDPAMEEVYIRSCDSEGNWEVMILTIATVHYSLQILTVSVLPVGTQDRSWKMHKNNSTCHKVSPSITSHFLIIVWYSHLLDHLLPS